MPVEQVVDSSSVPGAVTVSLKADGAAAEAHDRTIAEAVPSGYVERSSSESPGVKTSTHTREGRTVTVTAVEDGRGGVLVNVMVEDG